MERTCKKCGVPKELNEENFRPNGHAEGLRSGCRECEKKSQKNRYDSNPSKHCEAARKWAKDNPERRNANKTRWRRENPEKQAAIVRRSIYGLEDSEFKELFSRQGGRCAICSFQFPGANTGDRALSPHVDHCHSSGKVRGLLCLSCNNLLARAKDNPEILQNAIDYLIFNS